jgi:hypothetical protein
MPHRVRKLRACMANHGYSTKHIAIKCGVPEHEVLRVLAGEMPTPDFIQAALKHLYLDLR